MVKLETSNNGIAGYKTCPAFLKEAYKRAVSKCKLCKRDKPLEPHRVIRGHNGGLYTVCKLNSKGSNVMMICYDCHKMIHANENQHVSHSY